MDSQGNEGIRSAWSWRCWFPYWSQMEFHEQAFGWTVCIKEYEQPCAIEKQQRIVSYINTVIHLVLVTSLSMLTRVSLVLARIARFLEVIPTSSLKDVCWLDVLCTLMLVSATNDQLFHMPLFQILRQYFVSLYLHSW
jgi:hypothetical protein